MFQFVLINSCAVTGKHGETFGSLFSAPASQVFTQIGKIHPTLFFCRLRSPGSWSLSSQEGCSIPSIILMSPCCNCSIKTLFFLFWELQNWTQHSSCGLSSAKQKERITSPGLLAVLYLMQPKRQTWRSALQECIANSCRLEILQNPMVLL